MTEAPGVAVPSLLQPPQELQAGPQDWPQAFVPQLIPEQLVAGHPPSHAAPQTLPQPLVLPQLADEQSL